MTRCDQASRTALSQAATSVARTSTWDCHRPGSTEALLGKPVAAGVGADAGVPAAGVPAAVAVVVAVVVAGVMTVGAGAAADGLGRKEAVDREHSREKQKGMVTSC